MNAILLFAIVALGGSALANLSRFRARDLWRQIADDGGGTWSDLGGLGLELRMRPEAMPIRVLSVVGVIRLWSAYPVAGGPRFFLASSGGLPSPDSERLMATFGSESTVPELPTHRLFTNEGDTVAKAIGPEILEEIGRLFPAIQIAGHRRVVEILLPGSISLEQARAAVHLLARLTSTDLFGVGAILALPSARVESWPRDLYDTTVPSIALETPAPVHLGPRVSRTGVVTEAVAPAPEGEPFRVEVSAGGQLEGDVPRGAIPISAAMALGATGRGTLFRERSSVRFQWQGIETDTSHLLAGARLVAGFGHELPTNIYR